MDDKIRMMLPSESEKRRPKGSSGAACSDAVVDYLIKPVEDYVDEIWQIDRVRAEQIALICQRLRRLIEI